MNKKVFAELKNLPLEKSIVRAAKELATAPVLVAAQSADTRDLRLAVANDKDGKQWIYVCTDEEELSKTFPRGSAFVEMDFSDVLAMVGPDPQFGGIFVNSKSDAPYLIPAEVFAVAYQAIDKEAA